jgi:hypothetical protein
VVALHEDRLSYARAERRPDGVLQVLRHLQVPLPWGFHEGPLGGPPREPEQLERQVRELFERVGGRPEEATLVMTDRWLRLVFAEFTELPSTAQARDEALRFKLHQLVPFRPEELRLRAFEVPPLPGQEEPRRLAVAFALEALLTPIESMFERAGVRIGLATNESLALASAIEATGLVLLVRADECSYTVLVTLDGEPLLFRLKELGSAPFAASSPNVTRELLLTRSFLEERLPERRLDAVFVHAPDAASWSSLVSGALDAPCDVVDPSRLRSPVAELPPDLSFEHGAALLGAALLEVA